MPYGFNRKELVACVKREVGMRERVYPNWVNKGKMKQTEAEREIGMMQQVLIAVELATMCDNADLCVAAVFIELKKYMHFADALKVFNYTDMERIQKSIANHIRDNIYQVEEIEAELGLNKSEGDVGL